MEFVFRSHSAFAAPLANKSTTTESAQNDIVGCVGVLILKKR